MSRTSRQQLRIAPTAAGRLQRRRGVAPHIGDRPAVRGVRCGQQLAPHRRAPGQTLSAAGSQHRPTTRNRGEQRRGARSRARPAAFGPHVCWAPSEQRGGSAGRGRGKVDRRAALPIWARMPRTINYRTVNPTYSYHTMGPGPGLVAHVLWRYCMRLASSGVGGVRRVRLALLYVCRGVWGGVHRALGAVRRLAAPAAHRQHPMTLAACNTATRHVPPALALAP